MKIGGGGGGGGGGRNDLLAAIRAGKKLKKAKTVVKDASKPGARPPPARPLSIQEQLAARFAGGPP
jgi:WH2 motif